MLKTRFEAERPLDLTSGEALGSSSYDLIRLTMPGGFDEARIALSNALSRGEAVCLWLLEGIFEPIETGFRLLAWLHDFHPEISYATAADVPHPWALLWPAAPHRQRNTYFVSLESIAAANFSPALAGLMAPVSAETAPALAGMRLAPSQYLDEEHWYRLAKARETAEERNKTDVKLEAMFADNKPEQFANLHTIMSRRNNSSAT